MTLKKAKKMKKNKNKKNKTPNLKSMQKKTQLDNSLSPPFTVPRKPDLKGYFQGRQIKLLNLLTLGVGLKNLGKINKIGATYLGIASIVLQERCKLKTLHHFIHWP